VKCIPEIVNVLIMSVRSEVYSRNIVNVLIMSVHSEVYSRNIVNVLIMSVHNEGYSRNASSSLDFIFMFYFYTSIFLVY
jgi:hypothetical protein